MKRFLLLLLPFCLQAAVDGVVTNGTSAKPQAGVEVSLVKPGQQGMRTLGQTTSDAQGRFHFDKDEPGGGAQRFEAQYQGVTYNTLLTPNMDTAHVETKVFDSTKSPADAKIAQHMIVVQPNEGQTLINETVIVQNSSNRTFADPSLGGIRFFLPPAANGQVRVQVQGPGGMPLPRSAEKLAEDNVYKVDYPAKPGETQYNLTYTLAAGSPLVLRGQVVNIKGQPAAPVRFVAPVGVTLQSDDLRSLGQEPRTQATIYNLEKTSYAVNVSGMGQLGGPEAEQGDEADMPQVDQKPPPVYDHLGWLTGLALAMFLTGGVLLYRASPARSSEQRG